MRAHFCFVILALCIAACLAEAPAVRYQRTRQQQLRRRPVQRFQRLQVPARTRYFARQEAAPTPYPTAEELKPPAAVQPELTYGPPEQLYGPPAEQLPAAGSPQEFAPNPDAEEFAPPAATLAQVPARLTSTAQLRRRPATQAQRLAKLQTLETVQPQTQLVQSVANAAPVLPATSFTVSAPVVQQFPVNAPIAAAAPALLPTQQYFVLNQPFAYTAQFQAW